MIQQVLIPIECRQAEPLHSSFVQYGKRALAESQQSTQLLILRSQPLNFLPVIVESSGHFLGIWSKETGDCFTVNFDGGLLSAGCVSCAGSFHGFFARCLIYAAT